MVEGIIRDASRGAGRGDLKLVIKTVTTTNSSYQPGGDPVTLNEVKEVKTAVVQASEGYHAIVPSGSYSGAAFKVQLFYLPDPTGYSGTTSKLTEVASGTDISGTVYTVIAVGVI